MQFIINKVLCVLTLSLLLLAQPQAAQEFLIQDIRVEGLERISPGTVFNYLPMKVGDIFDDSRSSEAVKALFKTGYFDDVKLERDGNNLVIIIKERPSIGSMRIYQQMICWKTSSNLDLQKGECLFSQHWIRLRQNCNVNIIRMVNMRSKSILR